MKNADFTQHWHRIINTMNEGLMLVGPDGTILMVNRSFELLTGYSAEEVVGKPCTLLECDACERALNNTGSGWCKLFEPGQQEIRRCRCNVLRKDGSFLLVLKNASVLRDDEGNALGAVETLTDISELHRLDQQVALLSRQLSDAGEYHGMIGKSSAMQKVFHVIEKAALSNAPVLICGESGTGKELAARAIHDRSPRSQGPYVQLNCAALNTALLESELFGHIKGAFTGAYRQRQGRFEAAHGGTIFLDEIGDIPMSTQIKLLRVIESKSLERVGDHRPVAVDVRIISATNRDLEELIAQKKFRQDLFFRINVIPIQLPPLRERMDDIPVLVSTFMQRLRASTSKQITGLAQHTMEQFMTYAWPGNVRELKSALEYAFVVAEGQTIEPEHLPPKFHTGPSPGLAVPAVTGTSEKEALLAALRRTGGNQSQAARLLGVNRVTVWNRMRKHGLDVKRVLHE